MARIFKRKNVTQFGGWLLLGSTAGVFYWSVSEYYKRQLPAAPNLRPIGIAIELVVIVLGLVVLWSPFVAIGALMGRPKAGALIGLFGAIVLALAIIWAVTPRVH